MIKYPLFTGIYREEKKKHKEVHDKFFKHGVQTSIFLGHQELIKIFIYWRYFPVCVSCIFQHLNHRHLQHDSISVSRFHLTHRNILLVLIQINIWYWKWHWQWCIFLFLHDFYMVPQPNVILLLFVNEFLLHVALVCLKLTILLLCEGGWMPTPFYSVLSQCISA